MNQLIKQNNINRHFTICRECHIALLQMLIGCILTRMLVIQ
jgi:hypothetical protein